MLTRTKWILAGGAAAVALTPVAAYAGGYDFGLDRPGSSVVVESDSLADDAVQNLVPEVDPTATSPVTPQTAASALTPNSADTPASPVSAKSAVSANSPVSAKSAASPNSPKSPASAR